MTTVRVTAAQAIVRYWLPSTPRVMSRAAAFARMFGIFGHGNVGYRPGARRAPGSSHLLSTPERASHGASAVAYAKTRTACKHLPASSVGPGATNMVTGAALASINRLRNAAVAGDIFANRRVRCCSSWNSLLARYQRQRCVPTGLTLLRSYYRLNNCSPPCQSDAAHRSLKPEPSPRHARMCKQRRSMCRNPSSRSEFGASAGQFDEDALLETARWISGAKRPHHQRWWCDYSDASVLSADRRIARRAGLEPRPVRASTVDASWNVGPIGANGGIAANRLARDAVSLSLSVHASAISRHLLKPRFRTRMSALLASMSPVWSLQDGRAFVDWGRPGNLKALQARHELDLIPISRSTSRKSPRSNPSGTALSISSAAANQPQN